jgi:hypothetical protein
MHCRDSGDQYALLALHQTRCDFQNLFWRFARSKNHFRETFPQRPMRIHVSEPEVRCRCGLKCPQHCVPAYPSGAKFLQQLDRLSCCHAPKVPQPSKAVTAKLPVMVLKQTVPVL